MLGKIGSFFKKSNNDWLNLTVSIVFSIIMIIFFSKALVSSYALPTELPDTLTTGMGSNADRVNLFPQFTSDEEILALVPYYATSSSGTRYTVYCLDKHKEWAPDYTVTRSDEELDAGYIYLLENGYPSKSLTGNDANDDYLTQIALWWYQDLTAGTSNLTFHQKEVIQSSNYYRYIGPLIEGAVDAKNNPVTINPTFSIDSSDFHLSSDNRYLITDTITVNSNVDYDNYRVSVDNSTVEVVDSNNSVVTGEIDSSEGFRLRVNLANISSPITVNINVVVNYREYTAYSYTPPTEEMQRSVAAALMPVAKQKTVSSSVTMPTGSLTIRKVDDDNNALAGARIEVRRVVTNQVIDTFTSTTSLHVISNLLPGEYEIRELEAPDGYYIDNATTSVVITDSNLNISRTLSNSAFEVLIRKCDIDTGDPVAGAVLNILDSDGRVVDTVTTEDDYVSISNIKEGTYRVVEVEAPPGYLLSSEEQEFTVDSNHTRVTVDFLDELNEVLIEKRDASDNNFVSGAVLRLVRVSDNRTIDEWTTDGKAHSVKGLIPGDYKVIEVEAPNGYTLSNSEVTFNISGTETEAKTVTFYNSNNQITISKVDKDTREPISGARLRITNSSGSVIDTFTTTDSPYTIDRLDSGTYYVEELVAPDGYVPLSNRESFVVDENTTNIQVVIENEKTRLSLGKVDASSGAYVSGARLRLMDSNDREVETFTTSNAPYVIEGLSYGTYYLEEVEAPSGYIKTDGVVEINFNSSNSSSSVYTISNTTGSLTIRKIDSETGEAVSGALLEISDGDKVIETFRTTESAHTLSNLSEGTYYVRELEAPNGYIVDNTRYEVTISNDNPNYDFVIRNRPIIVNLGKIDARTGEYISGATMRLARLDGIMEPITFVSTNSPYVVKRLTPGIYSLTELEAPAGYVGTGSIITFRVLESGEVQTVNISNDITTISVNNRVLTVDTNGISDYCYRLETTSGEVIDEFTTTEDVYTSSELALGDYVLKQTGVPEGVIINDNPIYFSVSNSSNVDIISYVNDFTKVNISKLDIANSEEVEGAHLVIKDSNGSVVEEWISSNTPHYIEKLPVGKYTLTETIAPDDYVLNTSVVDFEVLETGDIQSAVMYNSKPIEVPNTGSNATYIYLTGGILILIGGILMYISYRNKSLIKSR